MCTTALTWHPSSALCTVHCALCTEHCAPCTQATWLCTDRAGGKGRAVGEHQFATGRTLSFAEIFYLATMGGARVMGLDSTVGNFDVGKAFDAIVVDTDAATGSNIEIYAHDELTDRFSKFLTLGDDRNVAR